MTIQDFMILQMPYKQKAETAFDKGDYNQAAEYIIDFATICSEQADVLFDSDDPKQIQAKMLGYNNASLVIHKILSATTQNSNSLKGNLIAPKIVMDTAIKICFLSVHYTNLIYEIELSFDYAMGLLSSMTHFASVGLYFSVYDYNKVMVEKYAKLVDKCLDLCQKYTQEINVNYKLIPLVMDFDRSAEAFCNRYFDFYCLSCINDNNMSDVDTMEWQFRIYRLSSDYEKWALK